MKRILLLLVAILVGNGSIMVGAAVRYDAQVWRAVQTYDLATVSKNLDGHMRELVAVKCNFRGKDLHHMKSNWYESSIWQPDPAKRGKFASVRVMIKKKTWTRSKRSQRQAPLMTSYFRAMSNTTCRQTFPSYVSFTATPPVTRPPTRDP